ncbi:MAG: C4-dicarboxylate ABC transporter [Alcanivorax sp.]|nr:MAG: C4-dicarboxylate ABC transporter [Alcanivorax sp.]
MNEVWIIAGMFAALLLGIASGHPIAFVFGGIAMLFGLTSWGTGIIDIFVSAVFSTMNNYTLVAIPLFTLMANFLSRSAVAEGLFESLRYLLGPVRGGLAVAVIVVSTIFAATTGIVGASVVTMGLLAAPVLEKYGYRKEISAGVITAGGTLGVLIPPSIMLIVMGNEAELSVGKLFLAAIVPGLLLSLCYVLYVLGLCWRYPERGPALSPEEAAAMPVGKRISGALINLVPPVILVAAVLGSIFSGWATPTEASGVGAFVALLMTVAYGRFSLTMLKESVQETAKITAMAMVTIVGAVCFTALFHSMDGDQIIVDFVSHLNLNKWGVYLVIMVLTFVLGAFIDWIAIVLILFPIFLPLIRQYDLDPLWVITCVAVMLQTAFLTPPVGGSLFYFKGVAPPGMQWGHILRGALPFVAVMLVVVVLISLFPQLVLWLPGQAKF